MDDYLTKPVMREGLQAVLDRWIGGDQAATSWRAPNDTADEASSDALSPGKESPIDQHMLDELRALGDDIGPALINELVADFGTEVPARFPVLRAAVAAGDISVLLHELHFVAGCAAIVGARHVERLARSIDASNALAAAGDAGALVTELEAAYDEAFTCLSLMLPNAVA
jgi:HPt (histidine-containing phosphotransfer) domain-containing protein